MADTKIKKSELKEYGIKLLSKKELLELEAGDYVDCDILLQSLLHLGYRASYENLFADISGFFAVFYIDDEKIGAVEGSEMGHMVRYWNGLVK